jgi:hypothetical protein
MKTGMVFGGVVACVPLVCVGIATWYQSYSFDVGCGNYLKRAADAPSIEMASAAMDTAIAYCRRNELTHGNGAIFFKKPEHDIGYWFNQLVSADEELDQALQEGGELIESNALMKLREVLLDASASGDSLTLPANISIAPNQLMWHAMFWVSGFLCLGGVITFCVGLSDF